MTKILITPTSLQPEKKNPALETLKQFTSDLVFNPTGKPLNEEQLIPLLSDCDGVIAGLDSYTPRVIDACPKLKVISRYGVGYDAVDTAAAKARGIKVTNTPGTNSEAVGELTFGLILDLARQISWLDQETKAGKWVRVTGIELYGRTIGIVGLGAIGKVVARTAQGFGMQVLAYDPYTNADYCSTHNIKACTLEELLRNSDVISLHLPLTRSTIHCIDAAAFAVMKDGVLLVNASRGGIIDEDAAYEALKCGKLRGLGLDAFEQEPPRNSRLFEFGDRVLATPHTGAHTAEATDHMAHAAVQNLIDVLTGQECRCIVNP